MTAAPGADERRAQLYLRARGLAYNPGDHMPEPITPTRVIPAAELPPRPPQPGEIPPWRTPPPPPPSPAAPEPPVEVVHRYVHEILLAPAEPQPEPTRWDRAWARLRGIGRPWQLALALGATVAPILPHRYSLAVTWMYCTHQTRADHGQLAGYGLAVGALAVAGTAVARRGGVLRITLLTITAFGLLGAFTFYDPITWITGVTR